MKKLKLLLTAIAIGVLFLASYYYKKSVQNDSEGEITIIVVNNNQEEVVNEKVRYHKNESLQKVLENNYDVIIKNKMLLGIEGVYADTKEYFLKIYINCKVASHGISDLKFNAGDEIRIVYTKVGDFSDPC